MKSKILLMLSVVLLVLHFSSCTVGTKGNNELVVYTAHGEPLRKFRNVKDVYTNSSGVTVVDSTGTSYYIVNAFVIYTKYYTNE